jgi:hypothetical protein
MTRLILTTDSSAAGSLKAAGRAEIALPLEPRLVWGPLRPEAQLAMLLARREAADDRLWSVYRKYFGQIDRDEIGLIDFCERSETIELWINPEPNAQLTLIWLLGYLRPHEKVASRLTLVQAETEATRHSQAERNRCYKRPFRNRRSRVAGLRRADA